MSPIMTTKEVATFKIKAKALSLGFNAVGVAQVRELAEEQEGLRNWLDKGMHAGMDYMANHFEKRLDPGKLVEGSKSVVCVMLNYFPKEVQHGAPKIAKYAYGQDYHHVVKDKLKELFDFINDKIATVDGRMFVDSAPVLERKWAQLAGLGWIGKNSLLINRNQGSFFFLGELIIDMELEYDEPYTENHCGSCSKCMDACPTRAIVQPGVVDARKCISYNTIEHKGELSEEFKGKFDNWMFGCDACQDVCPWNRNPETTKIDAFNPHELLLTLKKSDWENLSQEQFSEIFKKSAVKRAKYHGLKRNISFLREEF